MYQTKFFKAAVIAY